MNAFNPQSYGPVLAPLLSRSELNALGHGTPDHALRKQLDALSVVAVFADHVVDGQMAEACLAGVWLLHDFLDQSHAISQAIETPTGSFWHAIMHRREGDFGNAMYWFHRVGQHPIFAPLARDAVQISAELSGPQPTATDTARSAQHRWDACDFVDRCETAVRECAAADVRICQRIQRREWELLFDFCYHAAIGDA